MVTQGAVNGRKGGWRRRGGKEGETRQNCVESEKKERGKRRGEDCADTETGKGKEAESKKIISVHISLYMFCESDFILFLSVFSANLSVYLVKGT